MAAHMDGSLVVYDKEKEDAIFSAEEDGGQPQQPPQQSQHSPTDGEANGTNGAVNHLSQIQVNKSVHSKNQKTNPVAAWKLSNHRINAFAFSPDNRHLAVVSEDGSLRIIDYLKEQYGAQISLQGGPVILIVKSLGCWTCSTHTTAASHACAGPQTANTCSQGGRMTSSLYGALPSLFSSRGVRGTTRG